MKKIKNQKTKPILQRSYDSINERRVFSNVHKYVNDLAIEPPIGIMPKSAWITGVMIDRKHRLLETIQRYSDANLKIPIEWVREYNDLVEQLSPYNKS